MKPGILFPAIAFVLCISATAVRAQVFDNGSDLGPKGDVFDNDSFFSGSANSGGGSCSSGSCSSGGCDNGSCGRIFDQKYLSVFGGFSDVDNFERTLIVPPSRFVDGADLNSGYAAGFAIGGVVKQFIRNELEFTYRNNDVGNVFNNEFNSTTGVLIAGTRTPAVGDVNSYSGMYNFIFDVGNRCVQVPHLYIGGGLGSIYADGNWATAAENFEVNDTSFAYQFIGGINYPVRPLVDVYTEYRFLGADNLNVENLTTGVSLGDFNFDSHNVFFGVRVRR